MKKSIGIILMVLLFLSMATGLGFAIGNLVNFKNNLKDGKSAYEIALEHNPNIGTVHEWLASLNGKDVELAVKSIRKVITDDFSSKAGEKIEIVYGGSIDQKNISQFIKIKGLNGVLVGSGCLDGDHFAKIIKEI